MGINAPPENLLFFFFCLRFLPPGVGLTGSSRPSKVLLEFKALILKTEHKQTLQSVIMLDCIERILIDREDISHSKKNRFGAYSGLEKNCILQYILNKEI